VQLPRVQRHQHLPALRHVRSPAAVGITPADVVIATLQKNGPFLSAFPMFVPSLSWQNDALYIYIYNGAKGNAFPYRVEPDAVVLTVHRYLLRPES